MSPAADRFVLIEVTFNPTSGDYETGDMSSNNSLAFSKGEDAETFTITATSDPDRDDETVTLGFGDLPKGVSAGTPSSATVNLDDTTPAPNRPPVIADMSNPSVAENESFVVTFTATDPEENTPITWSLTSSQSTFNIGSSTGRLTFENDDIPDYETDPRSYSVTVKATDSKKASSTKTITVTVTNVIEKPGLPTNVSLSATSRTSLKLDWDPPTKTGPPPVTGYDVQYKKSDEDESEWGEDIHSGTGTEKTISNLKPGATYNTRVKSVNYEASSGWVIMSRATKPNRKPVITGPATKDVTENTTAVADYSKSDPDGDATQWLALSGTDAGSFTFSNGSLSFKPDSAPDYESKTRYDVRLGATDPYDTKYHDVTVNILDVGPPGTPSLTLSVPSSGGHENLDASWTVPSSGAGITGYQLQYCTSGARDDGESPANSGGQDPSARATCSTHSFGSGTTSTTLSGLKSGTLYTAVARATSSEGTGGWSLGVSAFTRANTAPTFTAGPTTKSLAENETYIGLYTATDAEGHNINWSLQGDDAGDFTFSEPYGNLSLSFSPAPDYENPNDDGANNVYNVTVKARDDGNPKASSTRDVTVTVTDVGPPGTPRLTLSVPSSGGHKNLDASWTVPSSGAGITGYQLQYCTRRRRVPRQLRRPGPLGARHLLHPFVRQRHHQHHLVRAQIRHPVHGRGAGHQ